MGFKEVGWNLLVYIGSKFVPVVGSCEHGNGLSDSTKAETFLTSWATTSSSMEMDTRPSKGQQIYLVEYSVYPHEAVLRILVWLTLLNRSKPREQRMCVTVTLQGLTLIAPLWN
jgi:hypothetical protein